MDLGRDIQYLKGVGPHRAKLFKRIGINTIEDLLFYLPRDLIKITNANKSAQLNDKEKVSLTGQIVEPALLKKVKSNLSIINATICSNSGRFKIVIFNRPYLLKKLQAGTTVNIDGVYNKKYNQISVTTLNFDNKEQNITTNEDESYTPIYKTTEDLSQQLIRKTILTALRGYSKGAQDYLPDELRKKYKLLSLEESLYKVHFPKNQEQWIQAKNRFVFEELVIFQSSMLYAKKLAKAKTGVQQNFEMESVDKFIKSLDFELTNDQKKVVNEIITDMKSEFSMNRLVQGDVGSGKTIVAAVALYVAVLSGGQGVLLVPTEILAEQHYKNLSALFKTLEIPVVLLTSSTKYKLNVYNKIKTAQAKIIIGTHAVFQNKVEFNNLTLIVTDEQHRFGVKQRAALREKGKAPDVLVMSATPIPRTISQVLYGDLDISIIKEMPAGRKPILTYSVSTKSRSKVYEFIKKQLKEGRQGYVVCPLIEESEKVSGVDVLTYHKELTNIFPEYSIGLLHGQLSPAEKDRIMMLFKEGKYNLLVSTTVVEVGVDVPNSTVIVIENAEKFGLAQLHQLRGRVGRSSIQSYCILICHSNNEVANKRMGIMVSSNDGFVISQEDLKLRGPGEFFGVKQHGVPEFKYFDIIKDLNKVPQAKEAAEFVLSKKEDENFRGIYLKINEFYKNYLN